MGGDDHRTHGPKNRDPCRSGRNVFDDGTARLIRTPALQRFYRRWCATFLDAPGFPMLDHFDFDLEGLAEHRFALAMENDPPRFVVMGAALCNRLGRSLVDLPLGADGHEVFGTSADNYRACARHQSPFYDYARYPAPDNRMVLFERLLLPFFSQARVTHVGGLAVFTEQSPRH